MIRKDLIVAVLLTFCLASTLFIIVPTRSSPGLMDYDHWYDLNDDGIIDMTDIGLLCLKYGTTGTPINKTALLLELQERLDTLNASCLLLAQTMNLVTTDLQNQINDLYTNLANAEAYFTAVTNDLYYETGLLELGLVMVNGFIADLQVRVTAMEDAVESLMTRCRIIPNGDFEKGIAGTTWGAIIDWNYELAVHQGNPPIGKYFYINNTHYYNRFQSLYTWIKTKAVGSHPSDSRVSQYLSTEQPVFTTANYITLWISGYGYTTSSRYNNYVALELTDGTDTYYEKLHCHCWGNNEGCLPNNFDYYNEAETGNDGNTWYRYTREIPGYLDKSNLTVTIQHYQCSWDLTTTESWFYLDGVYFSDVNGNPVP